MFIRAFDHMHTRICSLEVTKLLLYIKKHFTGVSMYLARTYLLRTLFGSAPGTEPTTSRSEVKRSIDSANPVRERKPMQLFSCLILCVHLNYQRGYNIMLKITFREKTSNLLLFIKPCDYLSRGEVHSIFD